MATEDEWVITPPAGSAGPTAAEWSIQSPGGSNTPPVDSWGDYARKLTMGTANTVGFGMPNRGVAAKRALTGESPSYDEALQDLDREQKVFRKENPWASGTAEAVGGVAGGYGLARQGLTLAGRQLPAAVQRFLPQWAQTAATTAVEGGLIGGLQGAGGTYSGIPSDYAKNTGMGTIFGAGIGAAAPAVGAAGGAAYRAIADRGWFGGIPKHLAVAAQADQAGLRALPNTPGAMLPDAGPSMQGVAQGALTEGPGSSALVTNLTTRNTQSPQRITADVDRTLGPPRVPEHVERGIEGRMGELSPAYERVLANARAVDPNPTALWLEGEIGRTAGPGQAALRSVRAELDIPTNPGTLDPHPGRMQAVRSSIGNRMRDPKTDDDVRVQLQRVHRRLTEELQDKVPGIRELDHQYAELGSQQRAVQPTGPGRRMFETAEPNVQRPAQLAETMTEAVQPKGMNVGPSAEGFRLREAARAEIDRIIGTKKNDLLALENTLGQPHDWNSQKLATMFGQERADAIMEVVRRERMFRDTHQKVVEGSQTARRLQSQKALEGDEGKIPTDLSVLGLVGRGGQELIRGARRNAINAGRDRIAGIMAEQDPANIQRLVNDMLAAEPTRNARQELVRRLVERGMITGGAGQVQSWTDEPLKITVTPRRQ